MALDQDALLESVEAEFALLDDRLRADRKDAIAEEQVELDPGRIAAFDEGNWREVLFDLGYLAAFEDPLAAALGQLVAEGADNPALSALSGGLEALSEHVQRGVLDPRDDFDAIGALLEALASLLALEGLPGSGEQPTGRPGMGELSLWSRVVQARLDRLGLLLHSGVGAPWGREDELALCRLVHAFSFRSGAEVTPEDVFAPGGTDWIQLSGNAAALIKELRARDPGGYLVAKSNTLPGLRDTFSSLLKIGTDGLFTSAPLIRVAPAIARDGRSPRPSGGIARPMFDDPEQASRDLGNKLGLRLVQIRLWQRGHCGGSLTDRFDERVYEAIVEAMEIYGDDSVGLGLPDVLRKLGDGLVAVNIHGLDQIVFQAEIPDATLDEADVDIAEDLSSIVHARAPAEPRIGAEIEETPELREDAANARPGFFGAIRRGFRTVGRVMRSVATAVRRGVARMLTVVDRLLSPIRDAIALALDQIRRVRRLLYDALQSWRIFLFGRPLVIGRPDLGYVAVRFSLDRDAQILNLNDPTQEVLKAFKVKSARVFRMMSLTLQVGAFVLTSIRLLATWRGRVRLVFFMLGKLRRVIRRRLLDNRQVWQP